MSLCLSLIRKRFLLLLLLLSSFIPVFIHAKESATLDEIKARGYLIVGVFTGTKAFGYMSPEGERSGMDIDIARYLAKELFGDAEKIEFVNTLSVDRAANLKSGKVDVVLANYSNTKRRRRAVDFAEPYVRSRLGVAGHPDVSIRNFEDLQGKKIIVFKGNFAEKYFEEHYPHLQLEVHRKSSEGYEAFKANPNSVLAPLYSKDVKPEKFLVVD